MNEELLDNFLNKESLVRKKIFKILKESESLENIYKEFRNLKKYFVVKDDSIFNYNISTLGCTREYLCELCGCRDKNIQKMAMTNFVILNYGKNIIFYQTPTSKTIVL